MTPAPQPIKKALLAVAAITALVLAIPLTAMQFTHEVDWTLSDFVIAGILLLVTGTAYVVGARMARTKGQRLLVGILVGITFLLIWIELAVGLVGTPFAGS
jgi:uncharacterized membrane protein